MKKRFNIAFVAGIAIIALMIGSAISLVGQPRPTPEPWTYWDVVNLGITVLALFFLGYLAAKEQEGGE